jgi:hypothetical protein
VHVSRISFFLKFSKRTATAILPFKAGTGDASDRYNQLQVPPLRLVLNISADCRSAPVRKVSECRTMFLPIAAVPLWLAAHALAAEAAQAGSAASVLPFRTFDAALHLVQYCTVHHSGAWFVSEHGSEAECAAAGGLWETRPGFEQEPEEVYNKLVEVRNAEVREQGVAAVWVVRVAADAKYYDSRLDDWERISGAAMADNMFVHERRQYFLLHATTEKVEALLGTGQFDVAMAMPADLLVHPEVIVADQHAAEDGPLRSLRVSHAVSLEDKQRAERRREELSQLQSDEERDRFAARLLSESKPKLQSCSFFEDCSIERSRAPRCAGQGGATRQSLRGCAQSCARGRIGTPHVYVL